MAYSKESERQNKALGDVLAGRTPEKRVMVGYEGKKQESGDQISRLSDIMKEARMPMFCPKCDVIMKKRLDNKMWLMFGHCFDCQIKIENKLRIEGKYEEWQEKKIKQNKISFLKDSIEQIKEWKDMKAPEWFNNVGINYPELEKEKWNIDDDKIQSMADEAIEEYTKVLKKLESE
jgi:ribosomal protein L37AE/L43A|tara:strand:- start:113 stop:640 length:528 start_codon:yes stop_codon:yes gene_type:complete